MVDDLTIPYQTLLDDTLTHQVRITASNNVIQVSCVCRKTVGTHDKAGKMYHDPIGPTSNIEESRRLYNNAKNHYEPFGPDDVAKW